MSNDRRRVLMAQLSALLAVGEVIVENAIDAVDLRDAYHRTMGGTLEQHAPNTPSLLTADYGDGTLCVMVMVDSLPDWTAATWRVRKSQAVEAVLRTQVR